MVRYRYSIGPFWTRVVGRDGSPSGKVVVDAVPAQRPAALRVKNRLGVPIQVEIDGSGLEALEGYVETTPTAN
jgi:hypothetical protein